VKRSRVSSQGGRRAISLVVGFVAVSVFSRADARNYVIERIASGLNQPTYVTQAPGDPANILYFTERTQDANPGFGAVNVMGKIWRYDVDTRTKSVVADFSSRSVTNDTGLHTIAFHPDFNTPATAGSGKLYVSSSQVASAALNRVEEFTIDLSGPSPSYAASFSRTILEYTNNRELNHTINWIGFDPTATGSGRDYLYISTGDGSFGNDYNGGLSPTGRPSQNPNDIAGKLLRVDVAGADAYPADPLKNFAIPASNPFPTYNAANPGAPISGLSEVYLTGLRNVYRASFDRVNGDLWMGDVGEVDFEEVDFLKAGSNTTGPPVDLGWPQREGTFGSPVNGSPDTKINPFTGVTSLEPIQQYSHSTGAKAVIGGYVYRGPIPELQGKYFYTDFVGNSSGAQVWALDFDRDTSANLFNGNNGSNTEISAFAQSLVYDPTDASYSADSSMATSAGLDHIVSFGEDNAGNVYLVDFGNGLGFNGQYPGPGLGEIFRIVPSLAVTVTVDRESGSMTFANQTGAPIDIRGYSIASAAGALDRDELQPFSNRLDAPPGGDGTFDSANDWQVTSPVGNQELFSEASLGGATSLAVDESFVLSPEDGWIQSIYEDLDLRLTLNDGSIIDAQVLYTGNLDEPFARSDLDFNGSLGPSDWIEFRAHHLIDISGMTKAESYKFGDLDGDGDNDFTDFRLFQRDYVAEHGMAAFAKLLTVPEPSSFVLSFLAAMFLGNFFRRRSASLALLAAASLSVATTAADAAIVRKYTFNNGNAQDSIGTAHGALQGNAAIDLGVLDLPGNTGDYLSLPGPTINIPALTDATFEAWLSYRDGDPWQYLFAFGRTQSGSGRDYIFYTPRSGSSDNRVGLRDNNLAENTVNGGPALSLNTPHHVAVVVDDNANGGANRMSIYVDGQFRGDAAMQYSLSDLSTTSAYLGRSLFTVDPYFNGTIEEFRIHNTALSAADVEQSYLNGPDLFDALRLEVNTVTGKVTLKNQFVDPLTFDYYRVTSADGALEPAQWDSLHDQNAGAIGSGEGESWDELGTPDTNLVTESFLLGGSTLASGVSLDLGKLYDPWTAGTREEGDLVFQYALKGEDNLRQGVVSYIVPPPLPGDYNDNGVVDAADYVVWRNHLNTGYDLPNEVAGVSEGSVTMADYDAWKERFGNTLSASGAGAGSLAVPEPGSVLLIALAFACGPHFVRLRSRIL
jgi:glucose/arabinose dehydrogenase